MSSRTSATTWFSLTLCAAFVGNVVANSALTPAQTEQAQQWLRQLSHKSYKTREHATRQLEQLGRPALKLLEDALAHIDDAEGRRRCEHLLELARRSETEIALSLFLTKQDASKLMKLPSWDRFAKLIGGDDDAKRIFVDMYCIEGSLLAELDRAPKDFNTRFMAHCQDIQRNLYTPFGQVNPISHNRVVALLFMATDPNVSRDLQTFYMLYNLFHQPSVQAGFRESAGSRKLLMTYLEQRTTPQTSQQIFYIAKNLGLKEALPLALKVVDDKTIQAYTRGMALLFIGQMGGKEHRKDLERFLNDSTSLNQQIRLANLTINTQMRDVALASLIMVTGQDIGTYNFPFLQQYRNYRGELPPYYYGFSDEEGRKTAFKRWKESQEEPKKK